MRGNEVSCCKRSGVNALAPWLGNPGRGIHQVYGQWGSGSPQIRAPLGASLSFSRRPRNRMGLHGDARSHAGHQLQRNVYRIVRSVVGRRWIFRPACFGQASETELFRQASRTRARNGCFFRASGRAPSRNAPTADQSSFQQSSLTIAVSSCR